MLPTLSEIESAADIVYCYMAPTPQYRWPLLSQRLGVELWLKHENHVPTGAFKLRGGLVYFSDVARNPEIKEVVTATRGNHGQSVALSARRHGVSAKIVVPLGNAIEKNAAIRALGATLIECGEDFQAAREEAVRTASDTGAHLVPAFHPRLIQGVATYAVELFRAEPGLTDVYVPIGLGSGICGVAAARNALSPKTRIVGVVSASAPSYFLSFKVGHPVEAPADTWLADGMACRAPEPDALEMILRNVDRIVAVTDQEIGQAMRDIFECTHNCAEGAGAAAVAAVAKEAHALKGRKVAAVLSGGNVDRHIYAAVLSSPSAAGMTYGVDNA
jgi:threonine dehydratase